MENYTEDDPYFSTEPIKEVSNLDVKHYDYDIDGNQNILKWANPAHPGFKQVHITRKEDEKPQNIDDGEIVYTDSFPIFVDNEIEENKTYYYRVNSGNITSGEIVYIDT